MVKLFNRWSVRCSQGSSVARHKRVTGSSTQELRTNSRNQGQGTDESVGHRASAVAFHHVRDKRADEAAGGRIGGCGEGVFEGDDGGPGDAASELACEG